MATESKLRALLRCFGGPIQDLEDVMQATRAARAIDTAPTFMLDLIGKIVGEPRRGHANDLYRRYLRAKIAANRSDSTGEDVISVIAAVVAGDGIAIRTESSPTAAFYVHLEGAPTDPDVAAAVLELVKLAKGGGIRVILHYLTEPPASVFSFTPTAHLAGSVLAGVTTLTVDSAAKFPASGTLTIDKNTPAEEAVAFTLSGPTSFALGAPLAHNHDDRTGCSVQDPARGYGSGHYSAAID